MEVKKVMEGCGETADLLEEMVIQLMQDPMPDEMQKALREFTTELVSLFKMMRANEKYLATIMVE